MMGGLAKTFKVVSLLLTMFFGSWALLVSGVFYFSFVFMVDSALLNSVLAILEFLGIMILVSVFLGVLGWFLGNWSKTPSHQVHGEISHGAGTKLA